MLCADEQGFRLHVAVRCAADDRQPLEQPCRCVTRPALANERAHCNAVGRVVRRLKTSWRDGSKFIPRSPPGFMRRLAVPILRRGRTHVCPLQVHELHRPYVRLGPTAVARSPPAATQYMQPTSPRPPRRVASNSHRSSPQPPAPVAKSTVACGSKQQRFRCVGSSKTPPPRPAGCAR